MSAYGVDKLKEASKRIDQDLGISNITTQKPLRSNETAPEPKLVEQPEGPLYAIYRRDPSGLNKRLFWGLTFEEALSKKLFLNTEAARKRDVIRTERHNNGLEYIPDIDELVLFDMVEMGTDQENPYWNPRPLLIKEDII